jgi:hypothetical protein
VAKRTRKYDNRLYFRADIFVFLLSTRAGGLGINLTAADTVGGFFGLLTKTLKRRGRWLGGEGKVAISH